MKIYKQQVSPQETMQVLNSARRIVSLGRDPKGELCIWYETGDQVIEFYVVGTGWEVNNEFRVIDTVLHGAYVWHLLVREGQ